ncbi:putative molybdopterin binding domain protein, partial [Desulfovibrio sp. A2]
GPGFAFEGQPNLRAVPVAEAVGKRVLHDMTRIVPGEHKDAEFTAGQELTAGDICRLQLMGRNSIYVQDGATTADEWVHEDEAAKTFAAMLAGEGVAMLAEPREGKANLTATRDGLLMVDTERLERFNLVPDVMCATRQAYSMVLTGAKVAGTRAIPLYLSRENFIKATAMLQDGPLLRVLPMRAARIGILVTGTEVFQGLIQDKFAPIITQKAQRLNCEVVKTVFAPDDAALITQGVRDLIAAGADLVVTTAGLSVDPDDVTRKGLMDAGLTDMLYGLPMLPGTMSLVGRIANEQAPHPVQVVGVPACALFFKTTALDILLPRLLAGVEITRRDLAKLGDGGLCMECKSCTYPKCPFGK